LKGAKAPMIEQARQAVADFIAPKKEKRPDKSAKAIVSEITDRVNVVDTSSADREDAINLAYVKGRQWIGWDKLKSQVVEAPKDPKRTQHTENRLIKLVQQQKSRIFRNRPTMDVAPATSEITDVESARIAKKVAEWLEYSKYLAEVDDNTVLWGLTTRIAFVHPYWNSGLGMEIPDPETGEVVHEGDIEYDVLSPFEVIYDPSAATWRDVRWACKKKVRDIDFIKQVYGVDVKPEEGLTSNNIYDTKMSFARMSDEAIKYVPLEHHARVFEYWELPSEEYPNGRRVTFTKTYAEPLWVSEDIGFGEADDTERQLPFFPFVAINLAGSVSGTNKVEQCRPIQREINRTRSQIIDNKDLTAYPQLLVEDGFEEEINNEIGGVLRYRVDGEKPAYLNPPAAGQDAYQNLQQLYEAFDFVSGMSQVSHGRAPSDASGYLVELLIEQDDTELAPTIENWIRCKQGYMSYSLKMIHFNYKSERKLRVVGRDGVSVIPITGDSINTWDVRLQRGSLLATSQVARESKVLNLLNAGVLNPIEDKDEILRRLEFGSLDDMYNEAEVDQRQARKEIADWEAGNIEPEPAKAVRDFFNHKVHIREHNRWRKSQAYEQLPDEVKGIIDLHVATHQAFLQGQMMEQAMMAPQGQPQSFGTPHSPLKLQEQVANGEPVGNSMQGMEPPEEEAI
jgi:hypothetical protein